MITLATMLWQAPWLLPAATLTLGIALAAVMLLYPAQMRDVPRGWRMAPPGLRVAAISALAVSMIQPAVLRPRTARQQGAIVILADASRSMSVSDRGRSPAELIALAAGLGTLPPGRRVESAPGLRSQLELIRARIEQLERTRGEAEYARLSTRGLSAAEARLADAADALRDALAALSPPRAGGELATRVTLLRQPLGAVDEPAMRGLRGKLDAALRALVAEQARADERLFEDDASVRTACIRSGRLSRAALVELALSQPRSGVLATLPPAAPVLVYSFADALTALQTHEVQIDPAGATSDITGAVRNLLRGLSGRDVQAVVLLSDGRQVGGDEPANADMSALRAPVFTIATAPPGQRLDLAIARYDGPAGARVGQSVPARVELRCPGTAVGDSIDVQLDSPGSRQVQRVTVGEDWTAAAEFELHFSQSGAAGLTVTALPLAGEISDQNNIARRWVRVGAEPLRVTVIAAADAGRQASALHEILSRAPWMTLREVDEADTYRLGTETLANQDVVILVDLPNDALWPEQWDALDKLARQRGGSVIMTAGAHVPAAAYTTTAPSSDWLPYALGQKPAWRTWPGGEAHFRVAPPRADDPRAGGAWTQLPALARFVAADALRPGVLPLLVESASGAAVVTRMPRGAGQVIFVGTDESWRWRGGGEASQFWPALLRLAAPQPFPTTAGELALDASSLAPRPHDPITLRARAPGNAADVSVQITRDEQAIGAATLHLVGDDLYEGTVDGLDAGDYVLRLDTPLEDEQPADAQAALLPLHVEEDVEAELSNLAGDERMLRRMADSSGGRALTLDQLPALPRLLAENQEKQTRFVEYALWDSPWLFGFVLACLSAEWALRKRFGLA
jgi:hypothetical protein